MNQRHDFAKAFNSKWWSAEEIWNSGSVKTHFDEHFCFN